MLLLEADDALALFQYDVVPLANTTVRFHLSNGVITIITEPNLVNPILASFDSNLSNWSVCWEIYTRLTSVYA